MMILQNRIRLVTSPRETCWIVRAYNIREACILVGGFNLPLQVLELEDHHTKYDWTNRRVNKKNNNNSNNNNCNTDTNPNSTSPNPLNVCCINLLLAPGLQVAMFKATELLWQHEGFLGLQANPDLVQLENLTSWVRIELFMPNSDILWQPASYEWHHHFCFFAFCCPTFSFQGASVSASIAVLAPACQPRLCLKLLFFQLSHKWPRSQNPFCFGLLILDY